MYYKTGVCRHMLPSIRAVSKARTSFPHKVGTYQISTCNSLFYAKPPRGQMVMNVFDRKMKRSQRNWTATLDDYYVYDYLKEEVGYRIYDRIIDILREFPLCVDLGCGRGHVSKHISSAISQQIFQCDMAEKVLDQSIVSHEVPTHKLIVDEEFLPFKEESIDLFVSSLSLHWVNDLPGTMRQVNTALKKDCPFICGMFGGDTLFELRTALQLAEQEREGGFSIHISPFTQMADLGGLLQGAGFTLITMDVDDIVVNYPSMFHLIEDIQKMGESNCAHRRRGILKPDTLVAAEAIYREMFGTEDGDVKATFQVLYFIGWKADPSQPKPAKRGSGTISFKDIAKAQKMIDDAKKKGKDTFEVSVDDFNDDKDDKK